MQEARKKEQRHRSAGLCIVRKGLCWPETAVRCALAKTYGFYVDTKELSHA